MTYKQQISFLKQTIINCISKKLEEEVLAGTEFKTIDINPGTGPNRVVITLHLQQPAQAIIHAVQKDTNEAVGGMEMTLGEWIVDLKNQQIEHVAEFASQLGITGGPEDDVKKEEAV
jgi:hypothetical protein